MKITIPRLSTSNAITFCRALQERQRDDTYFFDVSRVNNYEPLPMLFTAASIRQFCVERELSPSDFQLRYTDNKDFKYACHMGFFQSAEFPQGKAPGETQSYNRYIEKYPDTKVFTIFIAPTLYADTIYMAKFSKFQYNVDIVTFNIKEFIDKLGEIVNILDFCPNK